MTGGPCSPGQANGAVETRFTAMNTDVHSLLCGGPRAISIGRRPWFTTTRLAGVAFFLSQRSAPSTATRARHDRVGRHLALIAEAIDAYDLTNGAFDPTIHNTMVAAGYDVTFDEIDDLAHISSASTLAGIDRAPPWVGACSYPAGVAIDLGGIAKGAAADATAEAMIGLGAAGALVNIGGDLRVAGRGPHPRRWAVTLDCPGSPEQRTVVLAEGAVCTSTTTKTTWRSTQGV